MPDVRDRQTSYVRQTDVRQKHRLMPPPIRGAGIITDSSNNKTHSKNINGELPESQSHRSRPSIVSTQTLTAISKRKNNTQKHYGKTVNMSPVQNSSRKIRKESTSTESTTFHCLCPSRCGFVSKRISTSLNFFQHLHGSSSILVFEPNRPYKMPI